MTETAHSSPSPRAAVLAAAIAATVIWGLAPAMTKLAVAEVDALTVGLIRTVIAAPICLTVALVMRLQVPSTLSGWGLLLGSCVGCYIGFPVLFTLGQAETTTAHAVLIIATMPIFTGLFAATVERRMPSRGWLGGSILAFGGILVLIGARFGYASPGVTLRGDLLCLGSAVYGSAGYIAGSRLTAVVGTWGTTFWGLTCAGIVTGCALWLLPVETDWAAVSGVGWTTIGYLAIFGSILGYVAWYWSLARGGAMRVGPVQFLLPIVALSVAVVGLGEILTAPLLIAAGAVVCGVGMAQRA